MPSPSPHPAPTVGSSPPRYEGPAKVLGRAQYIDDLALPGMLHAATVRSSIARGRIRNLHFGSTVDWSEFTVVRTSDIPGENTVVHLGRDHPCLADPHIHHHEEPILLLAHSSRAALLAAKAAITVEYDELPGIFTIEASEQAAQAALDQGDLSGVIWNSPDGDSPNCFKTYLMRKDRQPIPEDVWTTADFIVEETYTTGAQEQLYIEPNGVIAQAFFDPAGNLASVCVHGSMQCPFYVVHALSLVLDLPPDNCRVIQVETGGAFGGKEDFPSVIASHAALLSLKAGGLPVKLVYDRAEDMVATTKRHPSRTRHRTAVSREGKLLAGEIDFAIDGGAYATLSPVVLSRGTIHAPGPYHWPFLEVRARAMATNVPPHGAFRGFGAPQSLFALERHMDRIAAVVGLSPEELRRRNFLATGDRTATGQLLNDPVDMQHLLTRALEESNYHALREQFDRSNADPANPVKRGLGFATFFHGAGFTGSGERRLNSEVALRLDPATGVPELLVSSTEFGQGTNTVLCQVLADTLHLPYTSVRIAPVDTGVTPNSGPTVASRTAMIVGKLVQECAGKLRDALVAAGHLTLQAEPASSASSRPERSAAEGPASPSQDAPPHTPDQFFAAARAAVADRDTPFEIRHRYQAPADIFWDDDTYSGEAYPAYAWAVYVAEVAVDTRTYTASVTNFHALQEVGRVLHPTLARGQVEGGVAQGIGYALYEKCVYTDGLLRNNQMTNYIMPTAADLPPIHVHFEEVPSSHGAFGAKGIGELPMDGPAPAILNAVEHATGIAFTSIPLLPEDLFARMAVSTTTPPAPVAGSGNLNPNLAGPYFPFAEEPRPSPEGDLP